MGIFTDKSPNEYALEVLVDWLNLKNRELLDACVEAEKYHQGQKSDIGRLLRAVIKKASMNRITYTNNPDNTKEVIDFIGPIPKCPTCGDTGEYETPTGAPRACMECCSRCIPYINFEGKRRSLDWGETLERREDGLHLAKESSNP